MDCIGDLHIPMIMNRSPNISNLFDALVSRVSEHFLILFLLKSTHGAVVEVQELGFQNSTFGTDVIVVLNDFAFSVQFMYLRDWRVRE